MGTGQVQNPNATAQGHQSLSSATTQLTEHTTSERVGVPKIPSPRAQVWASISASFWVSLSSSVSWFSAFISIASKGRWPPNPPPPTEIETPMGAWPWWAGTPPRGCTTQPRPPITTTGSHPALRVSIQGHPHPYKCTVWTNPLTPRP